MNLPDLMTIGEVMRYLRLSRHTLWRLDSEGVLPSIRINEHGNRVYLRSIVELYLEKGSRG